MMIYRQLIRTGEFEFYLSNLLQKAVARLNRDYDINYRSIGKPYRKHSRWKEQRGKRFEIPVRNRFMRGFRHDLEDGLIEYLGLPQSH